MNPQRYRRLDELFRGALAVPAAERAAWGERHCAGDATLRTELEALLAHDRTPRVSLEDGPGWRPPAGDGAAQAAGREPPIELEGYRFVRPIGAGGMGVVWEAEQESPPRRVAIKVLRPGLSSTAMLRRFGTEIRALARMDHPGVARIHDAGVAEVRGEPHPYLVMELVNGQPLLEWAERQHLDLRGRCELFARIADAVQGAHARGVIHRDLKRSNLLVDGGGQPKVLDFGVARLVGGESAGALGTRATRTGQLVGSLETMSPEQASGRPDAIDVRTDVYSLGCVLFELVAGRAPFDFRDVPLPEAVRRIHDEEPPRLSAVAGRQVGDLDTIVAKALAKAPRERYASASELAADVRRFLDDLPILARPATTLYQLRKFARRHRAQAAGLAIAGVALAAAFVAVLVFARREHGERQRAEEGAARLRELWLADALAAVRDALDGDEPFLARQRLDRLPVEEQGWERAWLEARAASVRSEHRSVGAQAYALTDGGPGRYATGDRGGHVRLYDERTDEPVLAYRTGGRVRTLLASDDGRTLAVATISRPSIAVHRDGVQVLEERFDAHAGPPLAALDPDGGWAVVETPEGALALREIPGGATRWERRFPAGMPAALAVDRARRTILVAEAGPGLVSVLDPADGRVLASGEAVLEEFRDLRAIAPGVVAAMGGSTLWVWDTASTGEPLVIRRDDALRVLEPVPGGTLLLIGDAQGRILELDPATLRITRSVRGSYGEISALCPLPDDDLVAVGYASGRIEFLDLASGRTVLSVRALAGDPVYGLRRLPGRDAILAAQSGYLRTLSVPRRSFRELWHGAFAYDAVCLDALGLWATGAWDGVVRFWNARDASLVGSVRLDERVLGMCGDREGRTLFATVSGGSTMALEVDADGSTRERWRGAPRSVDPVGLSMALAPDGSRVYRAADRNLFAYDVLDGAESRPASFDSQVVAIAPRSSTVLGVATQGHLLELDPGTLATRREVPLPGRGSALADDGEGGWLIGLSDGRLLHQGAGSGGLEVLAELGSEVMALALSPDRSRLATGTRNGIVRLWRCDPWFARIDLDPHVPAPRQPSYFYVHDLDWSSDGTTLLSCSGDETVRIWDTHRR